jgi:predicted lactoylglutathione lyase
MNSNINAVYINLPIKDVARARAFWSKLGFGFNEKFSDEKAVCLVLKEGSIYAMLITREFFSTFTDRPITDGSITQVLVSIDVGSRERLDEIMKLALANGAVHYMEPTDMGWMYADRFADPDGHQWEIMWGDESLMPKE